MKEDDSNADLKVMLAAVFLLVVAVACFALRNVLPAFAATSVRATAVVLVRGAYDEAGLRHAFEDATPSGGASGLEIPAAEEHSLRLWVEEKTTPDALKRLEAAIRGGSAAYGGGGPQDAPVVVSQEAAPVPSPSMERLALLMRGASLALLLAGMGLLYLIWQKRRAGGFKP